MVVREACPACGAERFKKNGHIHTGQQNHQCKACGRQCVLHADNRVMSDEQRAVVERLLCEKISLHGICRAVGVSIRWLMGFMVARFAALPDHLHVWPVAAPQEVIIGRLEVEADEMWSFVAKKANKQWVWIAMDKQTRQIIAFHVGDHSHESAKQLWANLPAVYREQAMFSTDQYAVYTGVIPAAQHKAITKQARKTNHIERFNNTLRQRVSRLVRDTLAFSKKLANHIGAIQYFICHYNLTKAAALPV
jgi:insertion element IS1 protein InsB